MAESPEESVIAPSLVTAEQFGACVVDAPIATITQIDSFSLSQAYLQAAVTTPPCSDVFNLLSALAGINLTPDDRGRIWGPVGTRGNSRTLVPSDVKGEQSNILEGILAEFHHPAMRARVADIIWTNDLRKKSVADLAIESYCQCVEGLLSGALKAAYPVGNRDLVDAQKPMYRALQIASATTKKHTPLPDRVTKCLVALYEGARKDAQPVIFGRIAQLAIDYRAKEAKEVAVDLEAVAAADPKLYPEAIRTALDYAGHLYHLSGDNAAEMRCQIGAVRQMLRMRDECAQAGAKASWVMDALQRLRHIRSDEAQKLEAQLEDELRHLQRTSLREMGTFEVNIEVPGERDRVSEMFAGMDLATALKSFAIIDGSPKLAELKARALKHAEASPLASMFSAKHVDNEGKTVITTPGTWKGEPPEEWFTHMIARDESLRRAMTVANQIDPARQVLSGMVSFEERHFNPIVWQSAFVPRIQAPIYALGFARFFQGDMVSAVHLLIPQLEPSLRHVLKAWGADPTKRRDDSTEEDRSLDSIIINHRDVLVEIMGAPLIDELNRLFNVKPGPALRHDVAHGQMSAGECYAPDTYYACWLLYRVCCLFVLEKWDEMVRPGLAIEEPGL